MNVERDARPVLSNMCVVCSVWTRLGVFSASARPCRIAVYSTAVLYYGTGGLEPALRAATLLGGNNVLLGLIRSRYMCGRRVCRYPSDRT